MLWGGYNNNVFPFTSLPGSCVILPVLEVSSFTCDERPGIFFILFSRLLFAVHFFVREKNFRSLPSHKKKSVVSKSVTEGTRQDSCSGKPKFETWKEKSKRKQIDTEIKNK
jgi:hypothetical protein